MDTTERYPFGFRMERVTRLLKNGEEKVYEVRRARGPPRPRKRQELRESIAKLTESQIDELLKVVRGYLEPAP